jgi:hypothetical protein
VIRGYRVSTGNVGVALLGMNVDEHVAYIGIIQRKGFLLFRGL